MQFSYYHMAAIFGLSEIILLLARRSKKGVVKNRADSRSLLILWVVITGGIGLGSAVALNGIWMFTNRRLAIDAGLALAIVGFIIRWTAILQLGKMFTVDVAIDSNHTLKTTGIYSLVRHPSYLGLMLIICSIALLQSSLLSCIIVIIPAFLALKYRIDVEEKALLAEFGQEYEKYQKITARLIPGIY